MERHAECRNCWDVEADKSWLDTKYCSNGYWPKNEDEDRSCFQCPRCKKKQEELGFGDFCTIHKDLDTKKFWWFLSILTMKHKQECLL